MTREQNTVTIKRDHPVEWYGTISLPAHRDKTELKARGFVLEGAYAIELEFVAPMTDVDAVRLTQVNAIIMGQYNAAHPDRKPTDLPREVMHGLHRVPNIRTADFGLFFRASVEGPGQAFYDDGVRDECLRVRRDIEKCLACAGHE